MAKRKVLLFIVEGSTEEVSLGTVLNRIFTGDSVQFHIVHGDILTKSFTTSDEIVKAVNNEIQKFCVGPFMKRDICGVVHLADTDGAYIPEDAVVEENISGRHYPYYTDDEILCANTTSILARNALKQSNLNRLIARRTIGGIPYRIYYMSSNLEHTLHDKRNLTAVEKIRLAEEFDALYAEHPKAFIELMCESSFSVNMEYKDSWRFIMEGKRSLRRHSNFGLCLRPAQDDEKQ